MAKDLDPNYPALKTWVSLNKLMQGAGEDICQAHLKAELNGRRRKNFVLRIHARLNAVRARRERKELLGKINEKT